MRRLLSLLLLAWLVTALPAYAALAPTNLTNSGNATSLSTYTTASVTPTSNALVLLFVWSSHASTPGNTPTATGNSLTWVQITTRNFLTTERVTMFRALGASPSTGTISIDFAGQAQTRCAWIVTQFTGADTSGTNGSGAVIQSASNDGTSATPTVTLGAFSSTSNGTYGAIVSNTSTQISPGSGFSEISDAGAVSGFRLEDEWKSTNDTSVDWGTTNNAYGAIAIEIAPAAAPPPSGGAAGPNLLSLGAGPGA